MVYFKAGLVLSVLFPGWKPLGLLPSSPLSQPTCTFRGCKGKSLEGTWAATLGPQLGDGGWHGPGARMGVSLCCLGNVLHSLSFPGRGGGLGVEGWAVLLLLPAKLVSSDSGPGTVSQQPSDISQAA